MTHSARATATAPTLWPGMLFLERGWLSANQVVFLESTHATVVDTGYCAHAEQTVQLLQQALQGRALQRIINTHLHSDHCGGNAALQAVWPEVQTWVAPGQIQHVHNWNPQALSYTPTGQACPRFRADAPLQPGSTLELAGRTWQVHAAPGHDPHSIMLFEPQRRLLISADALWENGFGVVFPEIEGECAFEEVAATLEVIEQLQPQLVLPGHGAMFSDAPKALAIARQRLASFRADPQRHARYAAKVLIKYKLLEWQSIALTQLQDWCLHTPYLGLLHARYFAQHASTAWLEALLAELIASNAASLEHDNGIPVLRNR